MVICDHNNDMSQQSLFCLFSDFQLLQNEVDTVTIADEWHPILTDCASACLQGNSHVGCEICDILVIQLKHCPSCGIDHCNVCSRVAALISLHHASCRQLQQRSCRCVEFLSAPSRPTLDTSLPLERVRVYLQSVFPVSDHAVAEDELSNGVADKANDDNSVDSGDKDYDSDSSDDSIMMPSFSDILSSGLPTNRANRAPGFGVPQGTADQIACNLPALSGRGIDSSDVISPRGFYDAEQPASLQAPVGVAAGEMSDPRVCISSAAPASAAGIHGRAIHSVPVTGGSQLRGRVHYGSKMELRQFASLWQVHADDARHNGTQRSNELPVQGIILRDFRNVSCFYR